MIDVKKVGQKILEDHPEYSDDLGCKIFRLARSNVKQWNPDRLDIEQTLLDQQESLHAGRTEQDLLYELLLKRGIDLAAPIQKRGVSRKTIYSVGFGAIFINAGDVELVSNEIVTWRKELSPALDSHAFFRDSAFEDDVSKTNMAAILEQNGINHVRGL